MKTKGVTTMVFHDVSCAVILATESPFKYISTERRAYKKLDDKDLTNEELKESVEAMTAIVDSKCVFLGGLEWADTPHDMFEVLKSLDGKHNIAIETGYSVDDFHEKIGRECFNLLESDEQTEKKLNEKDDIEMYRFVGHTLLSLYAGGQYLVVEVPHKKKIQTDLYMFTEAEDENKN